MKTSLSILVVSGTYPPDIGGSEISIHTACKGLMARGHHITVIADDRRPREGIVEGVPVIGVPPQEVIQELDSQHATHDFDLVMTQLIYSPEALRWAKSRQIPIIYFVRNIKMQIDLTYSSPYSPTVLIANSHFVQGKAEERWKREVEVIYPFIDKHETTPLERNPEYVTMVNPLVLKGGKLFYHLAEHFPDRNFLGVVGWTGLRNRSDMDWDARQWDLIAKAHGVSMVHQPEEVDFSNLTNVTLLDAVRDMRTVYGKTRILLFPSQWEEPFGRAIVEALFAGIPVIANEVGGVLETGIKSGGLVLPMNGPLESWIEAIETLDDPEFYETASRACLSDVKWYSLDEQLDKLERLCFSCLSSTSTHLS